MRGALMTAEEGESYGRRGSNAAPSPACTSLYQLCELLVITKVSPSHCHLKYLSMVELQSSVGKS